jgi:catechol 2,3-dioxygenase-like lactoylglutathione lyase family enzyme
MSEKQKVTGIGGVFFKSDDADALRRWYGENLGINVDPNWGGAQLGDTVWTIFKSSSKYFDKPFMINYLVDDVEAMIAQLRAAGVRVEEKIDDTDFGRFGWAYDPEGNRLEFWQPKK